MLLAPVFDRKYDTQALQFQTGQRLNIQKRGKSFPFL
jgi:hypothetical protein